MNKYLLSSFALAALLSACGGTFSAATVAQVFTQYPGDHAIINNASVGMSVPLAANDSIVFIVNPGTFSVNGSSIAGGVAGFTTSFNATATVLGTQLGYTLHLTQAAQAAFTAALNAVCTDNGSGGCTGSAATSAVAYTKTTTVNVPAGYFAIKATKVNGAQGSAGAVFQSANRVTFQTVSPVGSVSAIEGDVVFLMDLNSAKKIANPSPLPVTP